MPNICVITGGTAGIGKAVAIQMAARQAHIVLLARSESKAEQTRREIMRITASSRVDILIGDLSVQADIRAMADLIRARYPHVRLLLNNAGLFTDQLQLTPDGYELQWATNHLAPFLLTNLLRPHFAAGARIVNVSSGMHWLGRMPLKDFRYEQRPYSGIEAYAMTKLANILFTKAISKRLVNGQTANCLHPGAIATDFGDKSAQGWMKYAWMLMKPFLRSVEEGAATPVYLLTDPSVAQVNGAYFENKRQALISPAGRDEALAQKLWQVSLEQTGLSSAD